MMEDVDWVKILILMAVFAVGAWIYFRRFEQFKKIRRCEECGRILHDDEQSCKSCSVFVVCHEL